MGRLSSRRAWRATDSATWSEMGENVVDVVHRFGGAKIFYVHFRDVQGVVPKFQECFVGEGNLDMVAVVRALKETGFSGFMIDDHVPIMSGDSDWGHRGRAHAIGYMQALLEVLCES